MTVQTMLPRGIRNNNPLNIRLNPDNRWQGKVPPKHNSDGAFEQFHDPIMGLRAAAVLLIAHYDRRPQTHDRIFELLEGTVAVVLRRHPALPAVLGIEADVQRIVVADAARQHGVNGHGSLQAWKSRPKAAAVKNRRMPA